MDFTLKNQTSSFSHTEFIMRGFPGVSESRGFLAIPFFSVYGLILGGNVMIMYRIWVEKSLQAPMYHLIFLLFASNISSTTAIVPGTLMALLCGMDRVSLGGCLFQMFFVYTMVIFESNVLLLMALDRYMAICRPLRYHEIMTSRLLLLLSTLGLFESGLLAFSIIMVAFRVEYCFSNLILDFVCENMVLLKLGCGKIHNIQMLGLMIRIMVTSMDITLLLVSYSRILYTAMNIVTGRARHKTLHPCGTHLCVVIINYSCGLLLSIAYRMPISTDFQNLTSAIYYLFPATIHPLIYGYRVKEIRVCLIKS
ncbi:olfactory receptor 52Z1-like [Bufo gargarizans]|uniref:olfactory receptor 52Z1-like n=1 Tax=Bufo gargarizans TaxID=30331 RepID=UPI001CF3AEB4|nr:olfactory receptor 52Z1-like [Bufo gargarizans]